MSYEIQPPEEFAQLGPLGQRLYLSTRHIMRYRNLESIWIPDIEMCNRARIPPAKLPKIQNELDQSGLLRITPGLVQSYYELLPIEAEDNE